MAIWQKNLIWREKPQLTGQITGKCFQREVTVEVTFNIMRLNVLPCWQYSHSIQDNTHYHIHPLFYYSFCTFHCIFHGNSVQNSCPHILLKQKKLFKYILIRKFTRKKIMLRSYYELTVCAIWSFKAAITPIHTGSVYMMALSWLQTVPTRYGTTIPVHSTVTCCNKKPYHDKTS